MLNKYQIRLPLIIAISLAGGILLGATIFSSSTDRDKDLITSYLKLREILSHINHNYVDTVDTEELVNFGIDQMLEKLDPHSVYIPAEQLDRANQQLESNFEGIGIEFAIIKDTLRVVLPIAGGPSEEAGLRSGDRIIAVDGENIAGVGLKNSGVFKRLKGPKGTKVNLAIKRRGEEEPLKFTITRDKIPTFSVDAGYLIDEETGYVKVSRFAKNTYQEFKAEVDNLKKKGAHRLILDLRGNAGGYMDKAIKIADEFIGGNKLILYTDGKKERYDDKFYALRTGAFESEPLIVLIDEQSASASEIVSGALQDNDRALIVGRRSFGKGLVQMPIPIKADNSELRLTISRYYTPSGRSIQKPYEESKDYRRDINERYKHGEFFHADSIEFADSLKYETLHGRTVYGGGGIMPDFFVPMDTTYSSTYMNKLSFTGVFREYSLNYATANKKRLEKMGFSAYKENFEVNEAMLQEVIEMGKKEEVEFNEKEFERSKPLLKNYLKAYIARSIWKNDGFYPIIHKYDETLIKAMSLFGRAEALAKGDYEQFK